MKNSATVVYIDYFDSDRIASINFNFNERNTFSSERVWLLKGALDEVLSIKTTRCVIFNSAIPNYFSDGFSLQEMFGKNAHNELKTEEIQTYDKVVSVYERLINCPIPTISFVDGICRGGGFEWALSSDFIVATPNSQFALHEVRIGILPGLGGLEMLKNKGNLSVANYFLLTGNYFSSSQALTAGIVDAEVNNFQEMLEHFAFSLSQRPRTSLVRSKSLINPQKTKIAALHASRNPFLKSLKDKHKLNLDN